MSGLARFIRGIRDAIPGGYILGRTDPGVGAVHLVKIADLTQAAVNKVQVSGIMPVGANPTATAGPTAVNGSATTFMRSDAAPAIQKASSSVFGIVKVDGTSITASGGVISATPAGQTVTYQARTGDITMASAGASAASQGIAITPTDNMTLLAATFFANPTAAGTYRVGVSTFDSGTKKLTGSTTFGTTETAASTLTTKQALSSTFGAGIALTAGTTYMIFLNWSNAPAANSVMTMEFGVAPSLWPKFTIVSNTGSAWGDGTTNPPSTGDTWTDEGDIFTAVLVYE